LSSIDEQLENLFALLFLGTEGPLLASRMELRPDRSASSHFIVAPRPRLSRADMERIDSEGLMAEVARVLDDLPASAVDEVLARLARLSGDLRSARPEASSAAPPSLVYALH
jgi:hypothetical protein